MRAQSFKAYQFITPKLAENRPPVTGNINAAEARVWAGKLMVIENGVKRVVYKNFTPLRKSQPNFGWRFNEASYKFFFVFNGHCRFCRLRSGA